MGIDPTCANVSDLRLTRPVRRGPGGDESGSETVLGANLSALRTEEDRIFRRSDGREVVSFARFFMDPIKTAAGAFVEIRPGDLAQWTNAFGVLQSAEEIIAVEPTEDCSGALDVVTFRIGRSNTSAVG